jgi:putative sterol carrier protein
MSAEQRQNGAVDPAAVDANELARNLGQATDEQLEELMSGELREQILGEIFRRMAEHFRADTARDLDAVIHWRIGSAEENYDRYETVIRDGACAAHEGYEHSDARVTFTIGGGDFLKLVTGNVAGPTLFMSGKLKINGDLMFAASAASLFTIPKG